MDRLSIILSLLSGAFVTGAIATAAFSLGYYSWWWVALSAIFGFAMAWPTGFLISRMIKKQDPNWRRDLSDAKNTYREV